MGKAEAIIEVGRLVANYGLENISEDRVNSYVDNLCDIDPALLSAAVLETIRKQKFFPAVSELRETVARISGLAAVLPAAALELIRQADIREAVLDRGGKFAYEKRTWAFPPMNEATRVAVDATLAQVGEPCEEDGKDRFGWEMGCQKVYEVEAQNANATVLSDLSRARLPAPKPQIALPRPEPVKFQPDPQDIPIPTCSKCQKHMAFFETPEGMICGFCQRGQSDNPTLPRGDRE